MTQLSSSVWSEAPISEHWSQNTNSPQTYIALSFGWSLLSFAAHEWLFISYTSSLTLAPALKCVCTCSSTYCLDSSSMRKRPQQTGDERRIGEGEQIDGESKGGECSQGGGFIDIWSQDTDSGADNWYRGPSTDKTYKKYFSSFVFSQIPPLLSVPLSLWCLHCDPRSHMIGIIPST